MKNRTIHYGGQRVVVRRGGWWQAVLRFLAGIGLACLPMIAMGASTTTRPTPAAPVINLLNVELAGGRVPGKMVVHKFGENPACSTSQEDIWANGDTYPWLTSTSTIRIRSGGNAADTASGAGVRSIIVEGLDENWRLTSSTIATAGASASAPSTSTFIRVYRAYAYESGTYGGANTGDITIESVIGSTIVAKILAGVGGSQMSMFTIPSNKTGYFVGGYITAPTAKVVSVKLWARGNADDFSAPFTSKRMLGEVAELSGAIEINYGTYRVIPPKTDVWTSCQTNSGAAGVTTDYDIILEEN